MAFLPRAALTLAGAAAGLAVGVWAAGWGGGDGRLVSGPDPGGEMPVAGAGPAAPPAGLPPPDLALRYDIGSTGAVPALAAWLGDASPQEIAALAEEVASLPPARVDPWAPRSRFESWWWRVLFHGWTGLDREAADGFVEAVGGRARTRESRVALDTDFAVALAWRDVREGIEFGEARGEKVLAGVLEHLAELSPDGLLDLVRESPDLADAAYPAVRRAVSQIVGRGGDVPEGLEALVPEPRLRGYCLAAVATSLVASDPGRAIALARSLDGQAREYALRRVARQLVAFGDAGAHFDEAVRDLAPSPQKSGLLVDAAVVRARRDPVAARAWVEASFDGAERDAVMAGVVGVEMESDPMAALRYLSDNNWQVDLEFSALHLQSRGAGGMGWGVGQAEWRRMLRESMARALEASSSGEVIGRLSEIPDANVARNLLGAVAGAWADDDPAEASRLLAPLGKFGHFRWEVAEVMSRWAVTDPAEAVALAAGSPVEADGTKTLIGPLFRKVTENTPERSLAMIEAVPTEHRTEAVSTIIDAAVYGSIEVAVRALEHLCPEPSNASQWERVGGAYAGLEPGAAIAWAAGVPPGEPSERAHQGVAESLPGAAPELAAAWVESLPPGPSREAAVAGLVHGSIRGSDPPFEVALAWANQAAEAATRESLTREVVRRWQRSDAGAAAAAAEALGIPLGDE